jgi:hypothetical protein
MTIAKQFRHGSPVVARTIGPDTHTRQGGERGWPFFMA